MPTTVSQAQFMVPSALSESPPLMLQQRAMVMKDISLVMLIIGIIGLLLCGCSIILEHKSVSKSSDPNEVIAVNGGTPLWAWDGCGIGSFVHCKKLINGQMIEFKEILTGSKPDEHSTGIEILTEGFKNVVALVTHIDEMSEYKLTIMKSADDTLNIAGKDIPCMVAWGYRDSPKGHEERKVWLSREVPGGVVRRTTDNVVTFEVVDFEKK